MRGPAMRSCCPRHARASTCSATIASAAIGSRLPLRCTRWRLRMPRDAGLLSTLPRFSALAAFPREGRSMLNYDVTLAWASLLLLAIGLVMVYSSSIAMAEASAHTGYRAWYFLARHAMFLGAGVLAAAVAFQSPMRAWQKLAPYLFIAGAVLLVLVLVPGIGKSVNGSRRWLSLVVINVQPSEFMKLFVVLYAASY